MKELPKAYEPARYEDGIYKKWEESGFFNPDNLELPEDAPSYTIVLPPPNVTGVLHMGHAAMLALEDILIRYHRMKSERALWVPGSDHAAIATQTKVEKIIKEEGTDRHKLGREKFLERVEQYAQECHDTIVSQVKKMGSSCDWSREAYTLDAIRTKAVRSVFKLMYDDGLIYRGDRVVNWCPRCHSTLADDEVEYKAQKAKLYTFKYAKNFPFAITTTRPETKLGDTAVAVNPADERYKKYIDEIFNVDFCGKYLRLRVIADRSVDAAFGTGAVGVTPAHSMADWQMALANDLEIVKVIDEDGKIREDFGEYSGKSAKEAREIIVEKLRTAGLMEKEEDVDNNLSVCYRCETPIEPLPSLQWFINVNKQLDGKTTGQLEEKLGIKGKTIKEIAIDVVKSGNIKIIPERFEKNYFHWMDNLRDWCVSRQIWYGHRIPVWYGELEDKEIFVQVSQQSSAERLLRDEIYVGVEPPQGDGWLQDEDTLDTWFSSGLWTFSTLADSPEQIKIEDGKIVIDSRDFKLYHPTQVLETGYDILFFWVARMIIMTTYAVGDIPFRDVYLHGLIRDDKGRKMSKSLGNTINPLDMINKYGTDATRLSLIIGSAPGNDLRLSEEKIAGFRNFTNKLWNIARFVIGNLELGIGDSALAQSGNKAPQLRLREKKSDAPIENNARLDSASSDLAGDYGASSSAPLLRDENLTVSDKWILDNLEKLIEEVSDDLDHYRFSQAGEKLREFTWSDFADWYLEASKFEKSNEKQSVLYYVLETMLKLWHPFMPFVTEAIWREMGKKNLLMVEQWPVSCLTASQAVKQLGSIAFNQEKEKSCEYNKAPQLRLREKNISEINSDIRRKRFISPTTAGDYGASKTPAPTNSKDFELIKEIISAIRNARSQNKVEPAKKIKAVIYAGEKKDLIESQAEIIKGMRTGIEELEIARLKPQEPELKLGRTRGASFEEKNAIYAAVNGVEIYLIGAVDEEKEKARLEKEMVNLEKLISGTEKKLANAEFVEKAPEQVVEKEKEKIENWKNELVKIKERLGK